MSHGLKSETDPWYRKYEDVKALASETLAIIQERNVKGSQGSGQESSRLTATARRKLGSMGADISSLGEMLESPACSHLSEVEKNVRRDMVSTLRSGREQMQQALRRDAQAQQRSGGGPSQPGETVRTAELDNRGILQLQRNVMSEQDTELADLEKTVGSTKHIALTINEELGLQERLLDELDEDVDVTHSRLKQAQKKLGVVMRQSGSCKTMLFTIGLMFILMIVIVVCFKLARLF